MLINYYNIFLPWYFIPRVLKLAKAKMYVRNGYDGNSETENVLARHTALKRYIIIIINNTSNFVFTPRDLYTRGYKK